MRGTKRITYAVGVVLAVLATATGPAHAFPTQPIPQLQETGRIYTTPFVGSTTSMRDNEGSAILPAENKMWLADDNAHMLYEINPITGALLKTITVSQLAGSTVLGGTTVASLTRVNDLEAMAYLPKTDQLYAFAGTCCSSNTNIPTSFRLLRSGNSFIVDSYQPLAAGSGFRCFWSVSRL